MVSITVTREGRYRYLGKERLNTLVGFILEQEHRSVEGKLCVALVDHVKIRRLKQEFFGTDQETDVIAFPYGDDEPDLVWGEMILCPPVIEGEARQRMIALDQEYLRVTIHGLLHLLGYLDRTPDERFRMEERQERLLTCFQEQEDREKLVKQAAIARLGAYAPYSRYRVGAALQAGHVIYNGCNVENASLGLTVCAERVAVFKAVSAGNRLLQRIAVVSDDAGLCYPCGACRQVLLEFSPGLEVLCGNPDGKFLTYRLSELMPFPFQPSDHLADAPEDP